jgi:transcriptional regulator of acetoin/glycerol metabolism
MGDPVRDARDELKRAGLRGTDPAVAVVPDVIARSWRRSLSNNVASDEPARLFREIDTESLLLRAAEPVLDRWQHQLTDTGTTLFVSDRAGSIVARRASDRTTQRRLDDAHAAEGFDFSEEGVGTNGLGTAIAEKRPVFIEGAQHYNDLLSDITCAAVPLSTPTGSVIGAISLGGLTRVTNPLTMSVTREIGQQIEERLRASSRPQDLALAMSFMRYTNAQRPTVVLDKESLLANTPGLPFVSVSSHVTLWEQLSQHRWVEGEAARLQLLEQSVEVVARRILEGPHVHYVAHFAPRGAPQRLRSNSRAATAPSASAMPAATIVVEGPAGSGRSTRARALHEDQRGAQTLVEISATPGVAWAAVRSYLDDGQDVLLRRLEDLSDVEVGRLAALVRDVRAARAPSASTALLMMTVDISRASQTLRDVVNRAGIADRTTPLAESRESIPGLVGEILERVDQERRHTLSPTAMQALMSWRWPGNVSELVDVVTDVVRRVQGSVIERKDLPTHLQDVATRRNLTVLEESERDTIVKTLVEVRGNRSGAAVRLGIGRSTLYRRLRQLGIEADEASL